MAATPSMKNRDNNHNFHYFFMFDDENEAKVSRPIGAIDHDGWAYITYGPHYDPVQALNLTLFNFANAGTICALIRTICVVTSHDVCACTSSKKIHLHIYNNQFIA